jgi:hypothetical protein
MPHSPEVQGLLDRARALDRADPRRLLDALCVLDAARWLAWPEPCAAADGLETELLAAVEGLTGEGAAQAVLAADLAARRAASAGAAEGLAAIEALPAGYSLKSTWLRWREYALASGRLDLWEPARRAVAMAVAEQGVPPSETLPALLGRLDVARWRAQQRALRSVRAAFADLLTSPPPQFGGEGTRRGYQAAAGRWLVAAGYEAAGAALVFAAVDGLPLTGAARPPRLFSRPAPEAAVWLRRAIEQLTLVRDEARETLLQQAACALLTLARRHRAPHLLAEPLQRLPLRFGRSDVTALVLAAGAAAWLACGEPAQAHDWQDSALRLLQRHPRGPLAPEAAWHLIDCAEQSGDLARLEPLGALVSRWSGDPRLLTAIELARARGLARPEQPPFEQLGACWRMARSRHFEGEPEPSLACAGSLLAWGRGGLGLRLLRLSLDLPQDGPNGLPTHLADEPADAVVERLLLRQRLGQGFHRAATAAATLKALLREGECAVAEAVVAAAAPLVSAIEDPAGRFRAALSLVRAAGEAAGADLAARVETAAGEEAGRITERLRVDDPPR